MVNGTSALIPNVQSLSVAPRGLSLSRFRQVVSICPELFALREILARPDAEAVHLSPERRTWAGAARLPDLSEDSPLGVVVRKPRRNLMTAAPAKRLHVLRPRPTSPTGDVGAAEQSARERAALAGVSSAKRLVESDESDSDADGGGFLAAPPHATSSSARDSSLDIVNYPSASQALPPSEGDLAMVEVTLRPPGTTMKRCAERKNLFVSAMWSFIQSWHNYRFPDAARSVPLPPSATRVSLAKYRGESVPQQWLKPLPETWDPLFQLEEVDCPPMCEIPGVSALLSGDATPSSVSGAMMAKPTVRNCSFATVEEYLRAQPWYVDQIVHVETREPRIPEFAELRSRLHPSIRMAMHAR
jgi:hypothetical protein